MCQVLCFQGDNVLIDLRRERKVVKYIDVGMATYRKGLNFHLPEDQMSKFNFLSPEVCDMNYGGE